MPVERLVTVAAFLLFTLAFLPVVAFGPIYARIVEGGGPAAYGSSSLVITVFWLVNAVGAGIVGWLLGRHRLSFVAGIGSILMIGGVALAAGADRHWGFLLVGFGLLGGLGSAGIGSVTNFAAVSRFVHAPDRRTTALGIAATGMGFSSLVVYPLAIGLDRLGLATTLLLLSVLIAIVGLPAIGSYRGLETSRADPKTDHAPTHHGSDPPRSSTHFWSRKDAVKTLKFWLLFVAAFFAPAAFQVMLVHQVRILEESGLDYRTAAAAASVFGVSSVAYRILASRLAIALGRRGSYAIAVGLSLVGVCILFFSSTIGSLEAFLYAALFSAAYGAFAPMFPAASIDLFGVDSFASIHGLLYGALGLGAALGPLAAGVLRDISGSYSSSLLLVMAAMGLSGLAYSIAGAGGVVMAGKGQVSDCVTSV